MAATGFTGYHFTTAQVPMASAESPFESLPSFDLTKGDTAIPSLSSLTSLNIEGIQLQPQTIGIQDLFSNRADIITKQIIHDPIQIHVPPIEKITPKQYPPVPVQIIPQYPLIREEQRPIPRMGILPPAIAAILPPPPASPRRRRRRKAPKRKKKKIWWDVPEQPLGEPWGTKEYIVFTGAEPSKVSKKEKKKGLDSILGFDFRD